MATDLFRFDFSSSLTNAQIEELKSVTGMRIGDVDNPYKDTPGKGKFAGNVYIFLGREKQAGTWHISAFSHDLRDADLGAVDATRQRLRDLMPRIASVWRESGDEAMLTKRAHSVGEVGLYKEAVPEQAHAAGTIRTERVVDSIDH